jgi:pimeloyl-ACP methyl ester carboxylesterase
MATYQQERLTVNGVETVVLRAGSGPDLVFLHGAGTLTGFDPLLPLADRYRLTVPYHPGFGLSADDPSVASIHDYVLHCLDLFDALGIGRASLVGHSMGGLIASWLGIGSPERVDRLVLVAPFGLRVPEHPTADLFMIRDEEILAYLTPDPATLFAGLPSPPTPEMLAASYRERTSAARVLWERPYDPRLARWLHRLSMPTLLLWGEADRLIPAEQAPTWAGLLPNATTRILPGGGHALFDDSTSAFLREVDTFVGGALATAGG